MASQAHTTRRSLFAITGGIAAAVALPAAVQAATSDPWDVKIEALEMLDARLGKAARDARAAGWKVSELKLIFINGNDPFIQFQRSYNEQFDSASSPKGAN